jgi:hypothetical protein
MVWVIGFAELVNHSAVFSVAFSSPDSYSISSKSRFENLFNAYKNFGTMTTPAAETKSMRLPAIALAPMVFAILRQFHHDT